MGQGLVVTGALQASAPEPAVRTAAGLPFPAGPWRCPRALCALPVLPPKVPFRVSSTLLLVLQTSVQTSGSRAPAQARCVLFLPWGEPGGVPGGGWSGGAGGAGGVGWGAGGAGGPGALGWGQTALLSRSPAHAQARAFLWSYCLRFNRKFLKHLNICFFDNQKNQSVEYFNMFNTPYVLQTCVLLPKRKAKGERWVCSPTCSPDKQRG